MGASEKKMVNVFLSGTVSFADAPTVPTGLDFRPGMVCMKYEPGRMHNNDFEVEVAVCRDDDRLYLRRTHTYHSDLYEQIFGKRASNGAVAVIVYASYPVLCGVTWESALPVRTHAGSSEAQE